MGRFSTASAERGIFSLYAWIHRDAIEPPLHWPVFHDFLAIGIVPFTSARIGFISPNPPTAAPMFRGSESQPQLRPQTYASAMKLTRSPAPGRMLDPATVVAECAPRHKRCFNNPMLPALSVRRDDRLRTMSSLRRKLAFCCYGCTPGSVVVWCVQGVATSDHVP